jgi:hypothetical protein
MANDGGLVKLWCIVYGKYNQLFDHIEEDLLGEKYKYKSTMGKIYAYI